jgi:MYXO-CTERM domain-containing protein
MESPVKVTFTRNAVGDDEKSLQRIERAQGVAQVFLKAKSSASGQYYKEAFGVEEFRFDSCRNGDALSAKASACSGSSASGNDAPAVGPVGLVALLAVLALALRRRD